jgi:hypothetical protein
MVRRTMNQMTGGIKEEDSCICSRSLQTAPSSHTYAGLNRMSLRFPVIFHSIRSTAGHLRLDTLWFKVSSLKWVRVGAQKHSCNSNNHYTFIIIFRKSEKYITKQRLRQSKLADDKNWHLYLLFEVKSKT